MNSMRLAFRNLSRQKKRSFLLSGAIAFGFCVVIMIDSLAAGLLTNMSEQFATIFGGHVLIAGSERNAEGKHVDIIHDSAVLDAALKESGVKYASISKRTGNDGKLILGSKHVLINLLGCDIEEESSLADAITFVEGSFENMKNENGLIIGEGTAKTLKAQIGDTIVYQTQTITGQQTFCEFVVAGISKDFSLMGSVASYVNKEFLNKQIGVPENGFQLYDIMLENPKEQNEVALILEKAIRNQGVFVSDLAKARASNPLNVANELIEQLEADEDAQGTKYMVMSLNDNMSQIDQILSIVHAVSTGILLVLFFVVMVGISNTFKMIIFERIREIGTMRAVGMHQGSVGRILIWEASLLSVLGAILGFFLSVILMNFLGLFTFNDPAFSIFLDRGHWTYELSASAILVKVVVIIILTIFAVRGSAKQASRLNPAEALRTVK